MMREFGNPGPARDARGPFALLAACAVLAGGCASDDGMEPTTTLAVSVVEGDQVAATSQVAPEPLVVRVTAIDDGEPQEDATVTWTIVEGSGARTIPGSSTTDSLGLASTLLDVGAAAGDYVVRASTSGADPASIIVRAFASAPTLASLDPVSAAPGETVTIQGSGFSDRADDNAVFFDANRAQVQSATSTQLVVTVPPCMPTADADVTVRLGPLASNALTASIAADPQAALSLALGESRVRTSAADLACTVLPGATGQEYLVILENADVAALDMLEVRLAGHQESAPIVLRDPIAPATSRAADAPPPASAQDRFEDRLRALERTLTAGAPLAEPTPAPGIAASRTARLGQREDFQVFDGDGFTTVAAEVVFTSTRAVLYQDVNAPSPGFGEDDFAAFAAEFDDPTYDRVVDVYGMPSDVDANERVIILFTPVVNLLTPPGSDGFVAGFFFGLDLTTAQGSNQAEIFYSVVPDPDGEFGDARTQERILEVVPPVLAHEFQHMVHFNERRLIRAGGAEDLWLSEALAHTAESVVAEEFAARGNDERALDFELSNIARARRYLLDPEDTRLVAQFGGGTLAERGAGWMFMQYLRGHFDGDAILTQLTRTTATGVANVTSQTGDTWLNLVSHWLVANYADDAPELPLGPTNPRDAYPNMNLRADFQSLGLAYPLVPLEFPFGDVVAGATLPSSAGRYLRFDAGAGAPDLRLRLTGEGGEPFESEALPALSILRLR